MSDYLEGSPAAQAVDDYREAVQEDLVDLNETHVGCGHHPKYKVIRSPRTNCQFCWTAYKSTWPERKRAPRASTSSVTGA